jgi:hypothetical protein
MVEYLIDIPRADSCSGIRKPPSLHRHGPPDLTVRTVGPPLALSRSAVLHRTGPALLGGGLMVATGVLEPSSLSSAGARDATLPLKTL